MLTQIPIMLKNINAFTLIYFLLAVELCRCRKYDIEQQAQTLYGESLTSVVQRFRRTPEYLAILSDQVTELHKRLDAVADRLCFVFAVQLLDRVQLELAGNHSLRSSPDDYRTLGFRSQRQKAPRRARHEVKKKSSANMLDTYEKFHDPLTLVERNRMRELGFEYFGKAIHAMLEKMVPDDSLPVSTLLPGGGDQLLKHTTFHHHHEVTKSSTEPATTSPKHHDGHDHHSTKRLD